MSKGVITDVSIAIRPSQKLIDFVVGLSDPKVELPVNLLKVYRGLTDDQSERTTCKKEIPHPSLSEEERKFLSELRSKGSAELGACLESLSVETDASDDSADEVEIVPNEAKGGKNQAKREKAKQKEKEKSKLTLNLTDLNWLHNHLAELRSANASGKYLHELLEGSKLLLPRNEVLKRNPDLEARCQRLKREQDEIAYQTMTRNVDCVRNRGPNESIAYQMKQINTQLVAVLQFIFSVLAGFAFGFIGVELLVGNLDFGFRLLLGVICALVIALAEIYFLAKKLNEDLDYEEALKHPLKDNKPVFKDSDRETPTGKQHVD